jgi:large conductance mechanosensitive channel
MCKLSFKSILKKEVTMSIASEFKSFALRGNVMDLAVGVIIGAAFGKIVDSLVGDVIMPLIGRIIGNVDFSNMFIALADIPADNPGTYVALKAAGVPMLAYGNFLTIVINFVIFMLVKQMNRMKKAEPAPPAPPTAEDVLLLREIRDALKK